MRGENNVVVLEGRDTGEMVYLGRGAGSLPVATAILDDLIGLFDPARSWTGRYPRAERAPERPRFTHFLVREGGVTVISDTPGPGGIPLLQSPRQRG